MTGEMGEFPLIGKNESMKNSGCLITSLAMIMKLEGLKIDLTDKNGNKIKVEPNPLNVLRKLYTSLSAMVP